MSAKSNMSVCEVISSERLRNSFYGNPRIRIAFRIHVDGVEDECMPLLVGITASDYMFVYGLLYQFDGRWEVEWHRTRTGKVVITDMKQIKEVEE